MHSFDFDDATITSSTEASTDLVDDNVVNDLVGRKWRATGDANEYIIFDLTATPPTITDISIFGHNFTSGAMVNLFCAVANHGAVLANWVANATYQNTFVWGTDFTARNLVAFPATGNDQRYWCLWIQDAANTDTYVEVGRICGGAYSSLQLRYFHDWEKELIDPSESDKTEGRQKYHLEKDEYWLYNVKMKNMDVTDMDVLEVIFRAVKNVNPFVMHFTPTAQLNDDTIYCELITPLSIAMKMIRRGNVRLQFEEKA